MDILALFKFLRPHGTATTLRQVRMLYALWRIMVRCVSWTSVRVSMTTSDCGGVLGRPPPLAAWGRPPQDAARAARMCSSSTEAGSSFGSCGTSSPRKALASSGIAGFEAAGIGEQDFDTADDFGLFLDQGHWKFDIFKIGLRDLPDPRCSPRSEFDLVTYLLCVPDNS